MAHEARLVRCKECVFYDYSSHVESGGFCGLHSEGETFVEMGPNDFCSYGKKKGVKPVTRAAVIKALEEADRLLLQGEVDPDTLTVSALEKAHNSIKAAIESLQKNHE